jgi:hypothetical protein
MREGEGFPPKHSNAHFDRGETEQLYNTEAASRILRNIFFTVYT